MRGLQEIWRVKSSDNDSNFNCYHLDELVDEYGDNNYHLSVDKKPIDSSYSNLPEEIKSDNQILKFNVRDIVRIIEHKIVFR